MLAGVSSRAARTSHLSPDVCPALDDDAPRPLPDSCQAVSAARTLQHPGRLRFRTASSHGSARLPTKRIAGCLLVLPCLVPSRLKRDLLALLALPLSATGDG